MKYDWVKSEVVYDGVTKSMPAPPTSKGDEKTKFRARKMGRGKKQM